MVNAHQSYHVRDSEPQRLGIGDPPGINPPPPLPIDALRAEINKLRTKQQLSINNLVMRSGLSRTAVLDLLNGRGRIVTGRLDTWWALAWALDVPFGRLMAALDEPAECHGRG